MPTVLKCESVSKRYRIQQRDQERGGSLLHRIRNRFSPSGKEFWALRDVSFEIGQGESVGFIGHNGAGKSTLLKLLSNITAPTTGRISILGKISALLEVGSGFHPELTGRENVFLSGSILGMRRAEIASKLDAIVDFAEVSQFIDVPVKRYSSGMYVRLGFAIAAHLEPEILLLDEVLAVGDSNFQKKCRARIQSLKEQGTTIIFISHDLDAVQEVCSRVLTMRRGQIIGDSTPGDAVTRYQQTAAIGDSRASVEGRDLGTRARITSVSFMDEDERETTEFSTGAPLKVRLYYEAFEDLSRIFFGVYFHSADGNIACQFSSRLSAGLVNVPKGPGFVEFATRELGLTAGLFHIDAAIEQEGRDAPDWIRHFLTIRVSCGLAVRGFFYTPHSAIVHIAPAIDTRMVHS